MYLIEWYLAIGVFHWVYDLLTYNHRTYYKPIWWRLIIAWLPAYFSLKVNNWVRGRS